VVGGKDDSKSAVVGYCDARKESTRRKAMGRKFRDAHLVGRAGALFGGQGCCRGVRGDPLLVLQEVELENLQLSLLVLNV